MPLLPIQAANSCLRRGRRFLDLATQPLPVTHVKNELRRMALVLAVTAVDSYLHAVVLRKSSDVRYQTQLPKELGKLPVPFSDLASLANRTLEARTSGINSRPWVQVKNTLHEVLLKVTFQGSGQVARALSMVGVQDCWAKISAHLAQPPGAITDRLDHMVRRRNQIVHEGDLMRGTRPQGLNFNSVDQGEVQADLDWTEALINAFEVVIP